MCWSVAACHDVCDGVVVRFEDAAWMAAVVRGQQRAHVVELGKGVPSGVQDKTQATAGRVACMGMGAEGFAWKGNGGGLGYGRGR